MKFFLFNVSIIDWWRITIRYDLFQCRNQSSISSDAEFRWEDPEKSENPEDPENPDDPENPEVVDFLSLNSPMIMMSSPEQTTPDSWRLFSKSFGQPATNSSSGLPPDPEIFGSPNVMLSAAKLSDRFGTADAALLELVFGFGFLKEFDRAGNSVLFGSEEEIEEDPVNNDEDDPDWLPVIQGWDRISSSPIRFPGLIFRHLQSLKTLKKSKTTFLIL